MASTKHQLIGTPAQGPVHAQLLQDISGRVGSSEGDVEGGMEGKVVAGSSVVGVDVGDTVGAGGI